MCYEAVGRTASAYTLFLEVATRAGELGQASRERLARQRALAVQDELAKLRIVVSHAARVQDIVVERDGSRVGSAQWGLAVPVDPGIHRVRASGVGLVSWEIEVRMAPEAGLVTVAIPALERREEPSFWDPTSRKVGAAVFGVGLASLGLGTAFAVQAHAKDEDSDRAGCSDQLCPDEESLALRQAARAAGNRATWAFGVGVSGVAAGTALFIWAPGGDGEDSEPEAVRISPMAHARGGGFRVDGAF